MSKLPKAIRDAADEQGITLEALREKAGLSNGHFYDLLRGVEPKKLDTLAKLRKAGVKLPRDLAA